MRIIYDIFLLLFTFVLYLLAPFNNKVKQMIQGRKLVWKQIAKAKEASGAKDDKYFWVHCASLGEFEQGRPVIEGYKRKNPNTKILLTFFSPSGYEIRKNYEGADLVIYLPFDSAKNARRLLQELDVIGAVFVKYEFWFFYLRELNRLNIPTYSISSIFREKQVFFKWYGGWYRRLLSFFTTHYVQNKASKELLATIDITRVVVAGDTRFDRVADIVKQAKDLPQISSFKANKTLLVAGSTWPKDEEILSAHINGDKTDTKYVIAPHEVHESHITAICSQLNVPFQRYTQLDESTLADAKVLIVDCIGVLSSVYRYGDIAYIGGGFGVGIHNTLEAATYGLPVMFGPNYSKFQEAVDLVRCQAAFSISNQREFSAKLDIFLEDTQILKYSSKAAAEYVLENTGASEFILSEM